MVRRRTWLSFFGADFTLCLEKADMQSCSYYLEQLKAVRTPPLPFLAPQFLISYWVPQCQAAAKPY
jgi:hypothetical protein